MYITNWYILLFVVNIISTLLNDDINYMKIYEYYFRKPICTTSIEQREMFANGVQLSNIETCPSPNCSFESISVLVLLFYSIYSTIPYMGIHKSK